MSRSESYIHLVYGLRVSPKEAEKINSLLKEIAITQNINVDNNYMYLYDIFDNLGLENAILAANHANADREEMTNGFEDNHYIEEYYFGIKINTDEEYYISRIREGVTQEVKIQWEKLTSYIDSLGIKRVPDFHLYSNVR